MISHSSNVFSQVQVKRSISIPVNTSEAAPTSVKSTIQNILGKAGTAIEVNELGSGLVEVRGRFDDASIAVSLLNDTNLLRSSHISRVILTNLEKVKAYTISGIVGIQWHEYPYLLGIDGSMYFPNSVLPGGDKLVSITEESFSVLDKEGKTVRIGTSDLQVVSVPSSKKESIQTGRLIAARNINITSGHNIHKYKMAAVYDHYILEAASLFNMSPGLIKAVIHTESGFNASAVSVAGAQGLMQIMPATAKELNLLDPYSPEQNIMAGSRLLRNLMDLYDGELDLSLAAYNAGIGAVRKYNGIPPYKETQEYIQKVRNALMVYQDFGLQKP